MINIGNVFSHVTLKNGVCDYVVWFFYKLPKFDIINVDVSFYKGGHDLEMEAKLKKPDTLFRTKYR